MRGDATVIPDTKTDICRRSDLRSKESTWALQQKKQPMRHPNLHNGEATSQRSMLQAVRDNETIAGTYSKYRLQR